jgi:hypothetical protein
VVMPTTSIAVCTAIADTLVTDRAARTRGAESLRSTSGCAVRRHAPNGRRRPASPRPSIVSALPAYSTCPDRRRLHKRHSWRSGKSGEAKDSAPSSPQCVRVAANQLGRLVPPDTCRGEAVATRRNSERVPTEGRFPARRAGGDETGRRVGPDLWQNPHRRRRP